MGIRVAFAAFMISFATLCGAQEIDFPDRPIRFVVGFPAGGSTDVLGRTLADEIHQLRGWDLAVINKPGAGGTIAASDVVTAKTDGYSIGISPSSTFTLAHLFLNVPGDLLEQTGALLMVASQRVGIVVKADGPFRTLKDLIAYARANPGKVSIGTPGTGTAPELNARALFMQEKADVNVVPFAGDTPVATAILGDHITAGSFAAGSYMPHVRAGTMRVLATMDSERSEDVPDAPTLLELGYALRGTSIQIVYAPKGLPAPVRERLIEALTAASQSAAYIDVAKKNGMYAKTLISGNELDRYLLKDRADMTDLVAKLGLTRK